MTRSKVVEPILEEFEDLPVPLPSALPGEVRVPVVRGVLPLGRTGTRHGYHSTDAVEIPTSLTCNCCPLYHVKRKDPRHPLSCKLGRKHQVCPILTARQVGWVGELVGEVTEATGSPPTATDRIRIEQIVRHRSRLFQVENFLKVVGLLDLKSGEMRNVAERLTTVENALSRSVGELRLALAERRVTKPTAPTLSEYLEVKGREEKNPEGADGADD
jgi:hypothetical protein